MAVKDYVGSLNIAESLDDELLVTIGSTCHKGYEDDVGSRAKWDEQLEEWTKLAIQVKEDKSFPWPNAANVKYPLLSTAAMQFAARAYPIIVPSDGKPAKCRVIGSDPQGVKAGRAQRVSQHLSYQIMEEMEGWEEDTDRLLMILAVAGTCFRKTYFDAFKNKPCSVLVHPKDFVVNYWSHTIEQSFRKTQRIWMTKNDIQARINKKLFLDVDLQAPDVSDVPTENVNRELTNSSTTDDTTPYLILEQHTWLDLDEDDYLEPYIVTFEHSSKKVLRIVARFGAEDIEVDENGKVVSIQPVEYFTKFGFIPNPDGGFYDLGFGALLGALNESANTLVNQLIDAGTLNNLQSGFLAKGLRIKLGDARFQPGEWKAVNAVGDDLRKGIFPLPTKDPSNVLFQLLGMIVQSTKELASVAEIFVGKMPGQNTPATTTQATIEQGMKVFTSIFKRIYRALTEEFRKLYKINSQTIDPQKYMDVLDDPVSQQDYQGNPNDVVPAADPQAQTDTMKQTKAQAILQAIQFGLDPMAAAIRFLEANSVEDIQQLLPKQQQQQPDPKMLEIQAKMKMMEQKGQLDAQAKQQDMQVAQQDAAIQKELGMLQIQIKEMELKLAERQAMIDHQTKLMDAHAKQASTQMDLAAKQESHNQKLQQQNEMFQQKKQQKDEKPKKE